MGSEGALGVQDDGEGGLVVRALGLWLDPPSARPSAFVSHAHAASAFASAITYSSRETLLLGRALGCAEADARLLDWDGAVELPVAPEYGGGTARLTIAPAGHLHGAAQLVVDHKGGRFVYTGDWSGSADPSHPAGRLIACDELAVTTTFALPIFRFPSEARVLEELVVWCRDRLADGLTPVVLAQSPGVAQTVLCELTRQQVPATAREDVLRACGPYVSAGVDLGDLARPQGTAAVLVASPQTKRGEVGPASRTAVAYASGWALLDAAVDHRRADAAFVLADHADSDALRALVRSTGARLVHAAYGDARAFAELLAGDGHRAVRAHEAPSIDERLGA